MIAQPTSCPRGIAEAAAGLMPGRPQTLHKRHASRRRRHPSPPIHAPQGLDEGSSASFPPCGGWAWATRKQTGLPQPRLLRLWWTRPSSLETMAALPHGGADARFSIPAAGAGGDPMLPGHPKMRFRPALFQSERLCGRGARGCALARRQGPCHRRRATAPSRAGPALV